MSKEKQLSGSRAKPKSSLWLIASVYLLGIFMGAIDTGIVTPARTIIQNNLQVDEKLGIWMITIYTLAYAASIPIMGKLADKYGRKYIYLTAIFLFGMGSLFCGLSQNFGSFTVLLAARVVQAIGGGGIVPIATAEFGTTFPLEKRGMALGLIGGVYGIANIFGSSAGSAILGIFGKNNWQFIFYVNVPITIFIVITGLLALSNNTADRVSRIDKFGILLLVCMILSLLYGLKNIDFFNFSQSIKSTAVYPFIIIFAVLLPLFILSEKRAEDPVMNLSYFTNLRIVITFIVSFITGIVLMGVIFIPQFSENAVKIATGSGGYFVIILGLFSGVGAPLSGKLIDKFGAKKILILGFTITIAGSAFMILVTTRYPGLITVIISLLLIGLGLGFTIGAPLNYMMLENTKEEESNSALAALSLIRSIGTTIAPAIMIGFLAHAGSTLQAREMMQLPKVVNAPELPYATELTEKINKLKADPNMQKKLNGLEFPDLTSMTEIKINMNSSSGSKLPDDLLELMKTADVTNITERIKILSSRLFSEMTPEIMGKIQNGIGAGINGIQSGVPDMDKSIADLKKGIDGVTQGINAMKKAASGMETGIVQMKKGIAAQQEAITQLNRVYDQMMKMQSQGMGQKLSDVSQKGQSQGIAYKNNTAGANSADAASVDALTQATAASEDGTKGGAKQGEAGPPGTSVKNEKTGTMVSGAMPAGMKNPSIVDMIPKEVKAKIPANVLNQLKEVKTPADLKNKIVQLTDAKNTLSLQVEKLTKQRDDMLAKINETMAKREKMLTAVSSIEKAKADMKDTLSKMSALKEAVPKAFEQAKNNYLLEIDKLGPKIEKEFQNTLNEGFRQIYLTTGIAALAAIIIMIFYRLREPLT